MLFHAFSRNEQLFATLFRKVGVTASLDLQKDVLRTLRWTQLIYLRISNIISVAKNRLPNNTSYYRTKTSLLLNLSHHWHELTVNLDIFEEHSLWSTWPCKKSSNSVSNNNPLQLLHSVSADQQTELYSFSTRSPPINNRTLWLLQQDTTTSLLGHCQKSTF